MHQDVKKRCHNERTFASSTVTHARSDSQVHFSTLCLCHSCTLHLHKQDYFRLRSHINFMTVSVAVNLLLKNCICIRSGESWFPFRICATSNIYILKIFILTLFRGFQVEDIDKEVKVVLGANCSDDYQARRIERNNSLTSQ